MNAAEASAGGRKEGHFVAIGDGGGKRRELLVQREDDAGRDVLKPRETERYKSGQNGLQTGAFGNLDVILAEAYDFAHYTEEKDAHTHQAHTIRLVLLSFGFNRLL